MLGVNREIKKKEKEKKRKRKMVERCELCEKRAMIDCDSDQAKLCWDCDRKVHSANFLVAKHTRVLLCRLCNSPTPWKASGPKLTPTLSLCHCCFANRRTGLQHGDHRDCVDDDWEYSSDDEDSDHSYDADDDDDGDDDDDDEGENQVVPMSSASSFDAAELAVKPLPDNSLPIHSNRQDEIACSSSFSSSETVSAAALPSREEPTSMSVFRPLKERRINQRNH